MCECVSVCARVRVCARVCACVRCVWACGRVCLGAFVHACVCACVRVCVCVWKLEICERSSSQQSYESSPRAEKIAKKGEMTFGGGFFIGVNTTAFGRKLTLFQRHPAFPLFT